jgi:superoxide oxidase
VTIGLHWTTVVLIVGMFASAWLHAQAGADKQASLLLTLHRSLGVTLGAVAVCRLGWRLGFAFLPPFPPAMSKTQQTLAKISEYGLYALLLGQPLTGLAQSLAWGRPFTLFAWTAPAIMARNNGLTGLFHEIHEFSAWALLALIGLHILAALFHRFVLRDDVLQSMLPWKPLARLARPARRETAPLPQPYANVNTPPNPASPARDKVKEPVS